MAIVFLSKGYGWFGNTKDNASVADIVYRCIVVSIQNSKFSSLPVYPEPSGRKKRKSPNVPIQGASPTTGQGINTIKEETYNNMRLRVVARNDERPTTIQLYKLFIEGTGKMITTTVRK